MKAETAMTRIATVVSGLTYGLLTCLWVLATELVYSRAVLVAPVRLELSLLVLYLAVFGVVGLGAGLVCALLPRRGAGGPALLVAGVLTFLLLSLRLHDLADAGPGLAIDGGLFVMAAVVAAGVAWLSRAIAERRLATVLLAAYAPALVLAVKLLVNTCPIGFAQPIPVALAIVSVWPLTLALFYRGIVPRWTAGPPLVAATWLAPLAMFAVSMFYAPAGSAQSGEANAAIRQADTPPIIWITIDTLRADHMSVYGYDVATTPNLEEFARTATVYTACSAQAPSTWQSVPSMMTSLTPYRHGGVTETRKLPERFRLVPEVLRERGYQTIGQSANPWVSKQYGLTQGFEEFRLYNTDDALILYDVMKLAMRLAPWEVFRVREWLPSYAYVPFGTLVDDAGDLLRGRDTTRPLFLYMQPVDPHGPYQAPLRYVQGGAEGFTSADYVSYWRLRRGVSLSTRQHDGLIALYDGAITYSDAELGRLFRTLRELDLFDRAMIIVTADHGEQFFDHGLWRHSNSLYQQLLHIPLLVKYPGQRTGAVVRQPVDAIDIMPTIMRQLGEPCADCEGRPLQEATTLTPRPSYAYLMAKREVRPVIRSVTDDGWKLILTEQKDGRVIEQLYHVAADPEEQNDQRLARADIAGRLAHLLETYEAEAGPTPTADTIELTPAETQRLRALGYVE